MLTLHLLYDDLALRLKIRRMTRRRQADWMLAVWASDPANWCAKPACARCWGLH
ncbi:hypothetical protein [Nonomuraea soli]|uniref:Uncharacterized protein n=1 Tax=Nonomuraea soli TaxID=1032476 RepID=A0A7W0CJ14_9ACTN|nr:hypothetical protein [Nonomuraea soli]MBA2892101.1 hypothetical protein [Nonomuraea soli]